MVKSTATAAAGVAITAGAVGVGVQVFGPGEPAPQSANEPRAARRASLAKGAAAPGGTAIVRKTVTLSPGRADAPTVTLPCPAGTARRGPDRRPRRERELRPRHRRRRQPQRDACSCSRAPGSQVTSAVVTVLCKRPDASGSIVAGPPQGRAASGITLHVKVRRAELFQRRAAPPSAPSASASPSAPAASRRAGWRKVTTDTGETGWVRARVVA